MLMAASAYRFLVSGVFIFNLLIFRLLIPLIKKQYVLEVEEVSRVMVRSVMIFGALSVKCALALRMVESEMYVKMGLF